MMVIEPQFPSRRLFKKEKSFLPKLQAKNDCRKQRETRDAAFIAVLPSSLATCASEIMDTLKPYGLSSPEACDARFSGLMQQLASYRGSVWEERDLLFGRVAHDYVPELQLSALMRKFRLQGVSPDPATTLKKWLATDVEVSNLDFFWANPELWDDDVRCLIGNLRLNIRAVLGKAPSPGTVAMFATPGPGVTLSESFNERSQYRKLMNLVSGNASCYDLDGIRPYMRNLIWNNRQFRRYLVERYKRSGDPDAMHNLRRFGRTNQVFDFLWEKLISPQVKLVAGNKFFTVPKTSTTLRPCCKEASINMMLQRGLGSIIRQRLTAFGINLDIQDKYHEHLISKHAESITTIDLSAASDSISWQLVQSVFPEDWVAHFRALRAPATILPDGSCRDLSKISSMGNGFTFELESLMFFCALWRRGKAEKLPDWPLQCGSARSISVFGDDIIVAPDCYDRALSTLTTLGFKINLDKSHGISSPLRESCGTFSMSGLPFPLVSIKSIDSFMQLMVLRNRFYPLRHTGVYQCIFPILDRWCNKLLRKKRIDPYRLHCVSRNLPPSEVLYSDSERSTPCRLAYKSKREKLGPTADLIRLSLALKTGMRNGEMQVSSDIFRLTRR